MDFVKDMTELVSKLVELELKLASTLKHLEEQAALLKQLDVNKTIGTKYED